MFVLVKNYKKNYLKHDFARIQVFSAGMEINWFKDHKTWDEKNKWFL